MDQGTSVLETLALPPVEANEDLTLDHVLDDDISEFLVDICGSTLDEADPPLTEDAAVSGRLGTGEAPTSAPAAPRPLTSVASSTRATRWRPRHGAIGSSGAVPPVADVPACPAPTSWVAVSAAPRPIITRWGPRLVMTLPITGRRNRTRRPSSSVPDPPLFDRTAPTTAAPPADSPIAPPPSLSVVEPTDHPAVPEPWLLRFDGACRRNPDLWRWCGGNRRVWYCGLDVLPLPACLR
uniref:Uncharacterized protein n=1 Tax=Peronospora matthiolae TaxID=2874970 RepID=A0AAV1V813_9STRA